MLYISQTPKQKFLPLDAVSIKLVAKTIYPRLSLLLTQFMLLRRSLKVSPIHINFIRLLFSKNCIDFLLKIKSTLSNFGSVPVILTGDFIKWLIRIPNHLILNLCFRVIYPRIITRKSIATTLPIIGK